MENLFIEVKGIGIPNKGAELMLVAIFQAFEKEGIAANFVSETYTPYISRARYGLYQKGDLQFKGKDLGVLFSFIPKKIRRKFGIILESEIDVVIDASGFAYGDQWGVDKLKNRISKKIQKYKSQNKKVIFLPQAFGPFEKDGMKGEVEKVLRFSDLVFARDKQSLAYLDGILSGKAKLAPDFTNLVSVSDVKRTGRVCFIPNHKMVEKGGLSNYQNFMAKALGYVIDQGKEAFILVHEGKKDREIAEYMADQVKVKTPILSPNDPLTIKAIIAESEYVISSRFHGLVSALSQGVPAVATGWSHKYEELMGDYDAKHLMVNETTEEQLFQRLDFLNNNESFLKTKEAILIRSAELKSRTEEMWEDVFGCLEEYK